MGHVLFNGLSLAGAVNSDIQENNGKQVATTNSYDNLGRYGTMNIKEGWLESRAWCIRQLHLFPNSFSVLYLAAHYSAMSKQWGFCLPLVHRLVANAPKVTSSSTVLLLSISNLLPGIILGITWLSVATSRAVKDRHATVVRHLMLLFIPFSCEALHQ